LSWSTTDIWMPVVVGDYLAATLHLVAEQHGADLLLHFHLLPLEILDGDDVVARITGSAPNAWNLPADWQEHSRIAANPRSNPNKAKLAAGGRGTKTAAVKVGGQGRLSMPACVPTAQRLLRDALSCLAMPHRIQNHRQRYEQPSILPVPPKRWNDIAGTHRLTEQ
jgi:hypothetical protein